MALLNHIQSDEATPVAGDRLEQILGRVHLVELGSVRRYEQTDPDKVKAIKASLLTLGWLINPVVVDVARRLLIDGHHRVHAFEQLGLSRIPAFDVDYFSADLGVEGWSHATKAQRAQIERAAEGTDRFSSGSSEVVFDDFDGHPIVTRTMPSAWESARCLDDLGKDLQRDGNPLSHCIEADALRERLNHGYIRPVVGKPDVIEMVERGKLFPLEVNRHVVEDRPLGLHTPIHAVESTARFAMHLEQLRKTTRPMSVASGSRQGGRFYQERVTLFQTHSHNS